MAADTIYVTRYPELGFRCDAPGLWRCVDRTSGSSVGPHYKTKMELLADLDRYWRASWQSEDSES